MIEIEIWTVYDHPSDFPGKYVARLFIGDKPTNQVIVTKNINSIRAKLAVKGLTCLHRQENDDPKIMETWL